MTSRPDPASNNSTPKTKVRVQEYASIRNTPITKVEVFKETSKTYAEALKTGIEGRPTTNKVKKIHKFDRSRPGQQYKIRSPRIPQRKGDGSKFRQRNGRDKFHTNHSHNGYNALRRIRKKHSWKNPAEHDGGMPRGGKEAACGGFRYIHRSDGKTSRNTREDVGLKDNSKQAESVEKISGLGKGKGETSKRKLGCSVRDGDRCGSAGASLLCKESICSDGENRNRKRTSVELSCSTEGERSGNTTRTGNANDKFRPGGLGKGARIKDPLGNASVLEDCIKMGRDRSALKGPVHLCKSVRDHYRLVPHAEGKEGKPLLAKQMDGDKGESHRRDKDLAGCDGGVQKTTPVGHVKISENVPARRQDEKIHRPLNKKGCDKSSVGSSGIRPRAARTHRRADKQAGQACRSVGSFGHHAEIRGEPNCNGEGVKDRGCHLFPVVDRSKNASERDVMRSVAAQFTHRTKSTRIPITKEEISSPLHVAPTPKMDVSAVRGRMLPSVLKRFDYVWDLTFFPKDSSVNARLSRRATSKLAGKHARELVECGIAVPSDSVPLSRNVPFTVYEERETGNRQRFILWTKEQNELISSGGYEPFVPLQHISCYLDAVHSEVASCRDFKTGFYQVCIPEGSTSLFSFSDSAGKVYSLTRLPMGHVCAPELMNTIAAVVAGDPLFVKKEFAEEEVGIHWWIDNIRLFGPKEKVKCAAERMDSFARMANITWKPSDTVDLSPEYEFLGVTFDHHTDRVSLGTKIGRKIKNTNLDSLTASELESLGGRLLHASSIVGVPPGKYWFSLKYLRRVTNYLNKGTLQVQQVLKLPRSVRRELEMWIGAVQKERIIMPEQKEGRTAEVFVDASLQGWGGVIVWKTGELEILGAAWPAGEDRHINILEADALGKTLKGIAKADHLSIWVDNTTVCGAFRKKMCVRSHSLNRCLITAIECLLVLKCSYSLAWVSTKLNPADIPSREEVSHGTRAKVEQALGSFFNSRGGGGAGVPSNRNGPVQPLRRSNLHHSVDSSK